jgi:hypothetical protein
MALMRNSKISRFFSSNIASDETASILLLGSSWAAENIAGKRLPNQENSRKDFRIGIIETFDAVILFIQYSRNPSTISLRISLASIKKRTKSSM